MNSLPCFSFVFLSFVLLLRRHYIQAPLSSVLTKILWCSVVQQATVYRTANFGLSYQCYSIRMKNTLNVTQPCIGGKGRRFQQVRHAGKQNNVNKARNSLLPQIEGQLAYGPPRLRMCKSSYLRPSNVTKLYGSASVMQ